jgi:hypothetical protein
MRQRRRGRGCLTALLALLVLAALALGIDYGADALLFAPWAYGILGRPTLTGGWDGTLRTLGGTQYAVYLQLNRSQSSRGTFLNSRGRADLDGHLSWCARGVPSATSRVYGTANRSASIVILEASAPPHPRPGLLPYEFRGAWHGSTLVLHVLFRVYNGHAYVYSTAIPDEVRAVRLALQKRGYSAYQAACARI